MQLRSRVTLRLLSKDAKKRTRHLMRQWCTTRSLVQVGIQRFAESAIELGYRYWIPTIIYFEVMYELNKMIHDGFKQANIVIPFPQSDVHIINQDN